MIFKTEKKTYSYAPLNFGEVLRYAGAKTPDENLKIIIENCVFECEKEKAINYAVCFTETPILINGDQTDFSVFQIKSKNLATALHGAEAALIFACTVGMGIDRLIKKYSEVNPSRALIFQAYGAERIETFTDLFLKDFAEDKGVKLSYRFSPGYADLSLETQRDIFAILNPTKLIGLTLNDSLIMSPSKSVTAIVGVGVEGKVNKCENCNNDCVYRK